MTQGREMYKLRQGQRGGLPACYPSAPRFPIAPLLMLSKSSVRNYLPTWKPHRRVPYKRIISDGVYNTGWCLSFRPDFRGGVTSHLRRL